MKDEPIEEALSNLVDHMQIDFRKMRGFKNSFPNLATTVLYCLKVKEIIDCVIIIIINYYFCITIYYYYLLLKFIL